MSSGRDEELTEEQLAPIVARGVSVALSAGAGCGKTTVLTERFVSHLELEPRVAVSEIVALTFTEKAARELRDRVRTACRKRLESGEDTIYWQSIARNLDSAKVSTFHAFCGDVLRRYAIEAGVDPAFEVLDESIAPTIRERSLDASLRRWLASRDPDFALLAVDYGLNTIRTSLSQLLANPPSFDPSQWASLTPDQVLKVWSDFQHSGALKPILEDFVKSHEGTLRFLSDHECTNAKMKARCQFLITNLRRLPMATSPAVELSELVAEAKVMGGGGATAWPSAEVYEEVKKRLEKLRAAIKAALELFSADLKTSRKCAEATVRFARIAADAVAEYGRTKALEGWLDFHDLQSLLLRILRDNPVVRQELSRSIQVLLVDEFQDTDAIQAEILERLAGDGLVDGRMFLVGDAKQSIYSFRGAEPSIFATFRERFPDAGRLNLSGNFRSVPEILHFVNALFGAAFEGPEHHLKPGLAVRVDDKSKRPAVEFLWADGASGESLAAERQLAEARAVSQLLASRLAEGWMIRDRKTGDPRFARAGDVALLFRASRGFSVYEQALASVGLDYHVIGGSAFFAQQEVIDILNLLATIEDPLDSLALAGALRGPFFGVSDEGIYWLATISSGDLAAGLADWRRVEGMLKSDDRQAISRSVMLLQRWRSRKDRLPISELLDRALSESGFEAALLGEFLGPRKRANVRKLVRLAARFDSRGSLSLGDFVARLRDDVIESPREEQAVTADEGGEAIRLMTIHQAKGLEFPIVVIPDIDKKPHAGTDFVLAHDVLGLLLRPSTEGEEHEDSLGRTMAKQLGALADREEAIRVFYVATTRARDSLILASGSIPSHNSSSPTSKLLAQRFDLLTGRFLGDLEEGQAPPRVSVIKPEPLGQVSARVRKTFRPKILVTARQITDYPAAKSVEPDRGRTPPQSHIQLNRTVEDSPTLREVDRLVRRSLTDSMIDSDSAIDQVLDRASKSLGVLLPRQVRKISRERLMEWRSLEICSNIATATKVRTAIPWSLAWPPDASSPTIYSGIIDFAYRDQSGRWWTAYVVVNESRAAVERACLSARLATYATEALGIFPIEGAWVISLGESSTCQRIGDLSDERVEHTIEAESKSGSDVEPNGIWA